jgi:hypothetical protein
MEGKSDEAAGGSVSRLRHRPDRPWTDDVANGALGQIVERNENDQ